VSALRIDRCVCDRVTFATLHEIARAAHVDDEASLRRACDARGVQFGRTCRLCVPYVKDMLRTGTLVFDRILVDEG